ncbi:bile acid:sodium symporter family protein [Celeribacter litoreus]|uniref:bile acid:sodium symporter family protein n=1 Tax=Celeribacter litoreus TaxID=2876714 RepID=UPI001CD0131A|nr:bile acid:sodium symporter family protein [Celeribacter litoreus]MCA0044961.1 bile acid:sodium symporter [Celeribacter litoreus]
MRFLRRIGVDTYMLLLISMVGLGIVFPASGVAATGLKFLTFWAVALLFFLYGAKLDPQSMRAGLLNWRLQGLTLLATYLMLPLIGVTLAAVFGPLLGVTVTLGLLFLSVLPSTVQSSIAFTSISGGNVPAAICAASTSNILGVFLTPLLMAVLMHQGGGGLRLDAVIKIGTQILAPFVVGQLVRPFIGAFVLRHRTATMVVDRGSILMIVYSAFSAGTVGGLWSAIPVSSLLSLFGVVWLFLAINLLLMPFAGRVLGLVYEDRTVVLYVGATKSLASGLPIAAALFDPEMVGAIVLPVMIYHMSQLLVCAFIAQRLAQSNSHRVII